MIFPTLNKFILYLLMNVYILQVFYYNYNNYNYANNYTNNNYTHLGDGTQNITNYLQSIRLKCSSFSFPPQNRYLQNHTTWGTAPLNSVLEINRYTY